MPPGSRRSPRTSAASRNGCALWRLPTWPWTKQWSFLGGPQSSSSTKTSARTRKALWSPWHATGGSRAPPLLRGAFARRAPHPCAKSWRTLKSSAACSAAVTPLRASAGATGQPGSHTIQTASRLVAALTRRYDQRCLCQVLRLLQASM